MLWSHFIAYGIENQKMIINPWFLHYSQYFEEVENDFLFLYPKKKKLKILFPLNNRIFGKLTFFIKVCRFLNLRIVTVISLQDIYHTKFNLEDPANVPQLENYFTFCNGWQFRAPNLVKKYRPDIVKFFKPKKDIIEKVGKKMKELRTNNDLIVGVHIRRGDFTLFLNGRFFYPDYIYDRMIGRFTSLVEEKKILFLLCTNGGVDLKNFKHSDIRLNNGNEIEDLISLSQCDYIIGPPSTFNIWASFYGEVLTYHIEDPGYEFTLNDFRVMYDLNIKF